jgi:hypothetical protein
VGEHPPPRHPPPRVVRVRHPVRHGDVGMVELGHLGRQFLHVLDVAVVEFRLRDQRWRHDDAAARLLAGKHHGERAHRNLADDGRVGGGRRDPCTAGLAHRRDVGGGDVGRINLDVRGKPRLIDRDLHAFRELVIGCEHDLDARIGGQHRARLIGDGVGDRIVERAEHGDFLDARIAFLEFAPGLVAPVERCDAGNVDIGCLPGLPIVLDSLFQREPCEVAVGLLDLRDRLVLDVHVEGDDLDAGVDCTLGGFLHGFGQAVLDDDAVDAERDRLVDHVGLQRRILTAVQNAQVDAQRLGLRFDTGEIGLEEVTGGQVPHQCDLDVGGIVEGRRPVLCQRRQGEDAGGRGQAKGAECPASNAHARFLHSVACCSLVEPVISPCWRARM